MDITLDVQGLKYKSLIESIEEWVWEIDCNGFYTYSSPQVFQLIGYKPEEVIGKSPLDFMTPEQARLVASEFKNTLRNQEGIHLVDSDHLHKDGRVINIETSGKPIFNDQGQFLGLRGVDRDITQKIVEQREKDNLVSAVTQMAEAAVFVDKNLRINFINKAFIDFFGYQEKDILGKPLSTLNPPKEGHVTTEEVVGSLNANGKWSGDVFRKSADGELIPVFLHAGAVYDSKGISGYTGTYLDLRELQSTLRNLHESYIDTISAIALTIEKRDPFTSGHQKRVSEICSKLATKLGESENFIEGLAFGALIHDIGILQIPAEILTYPGRLSPVQRTLIEEHAQAGYDIIKNVNFPWPVKDMILQHHERLDGTGYPNGLTGDQIIKEAKFIAVCDVYEALTAHRPYRPAFPTHEVIKTLEEARGTQLDGEIVDTLIEMIKSGEI